MGKSPESVAKISKNFFLYIIVTEKTVIVNVATVQHFLTMSRDSATIDLTYLNKRSFIMKITTVLFDLDGTLLPMDNDEFTKGYFKHLVKKLAPYGYKPQALIDGVWAGTAAMVKNDGSVTNEEAFWRKFAEIFGDKAYEHKPICDEFYANEFNNARELCGQNPKAVQIVKELKEHGIRVALATNPIFPKVATDNRISWAGLEPEDFELYTYYENSSYSKPNPEYYKVVLDRLGVKAEECLMVGNDATEDMIAETLGMNVFLLTDCLLNKQGVDISQYPQGSFDDLEEYLKTQI